MRRRKGATLAATIAGLLTAYMLPSVLPTARASSSRPHHLKHAARSHRSGNLHAAHAAAVCVTSPQSAKKSYDRQRKVCPTAVSTPYPLVNPHNVGDIFGVGSFVTQRSSTVSSLLLHRAHLLGAHWVREE